MAQNFFINQNSILPILRMELVDTGRYDFKKNHIMNTGIQNANVTFSMKDIDTGVYVISKAPAEIVFTSTDSCEEKAVLQYKWNKRDVKNKGTFIGTFEISFNGDISEEGYDFPEGNLIVPIQDELNICVK